MTVMCPLAFGSNPLWNCVEKGSNHGGFSQSVSAGQAKPGPGLVRRPSASFARNLARQANKHHKVDFASAETEDEDGEVSDKARANFREAIPKKSRRQPDSTLRATCLPSRLLSGLHVGGSRPSGFRTHGYEGSTFLGFVLRVQGLSDLGIWGLCGV